MQGPDSNQAGATLATLANAANAAEERDEATAGAASADEKKKSTQYQPITDEAELAALRSQGLTSKGENKVTKGDLRCRPPRIYSETFFDKKLPQFRLRTVVETARAEDVLMAWAFVTKRDTKLRASEFRFDHKNYLEDEVLVTELKNLGNSSDAMVAYLKGRFGTLREPKREPILSLPTTTTATGTATVYHGSMGTSDHATLLASQMQQNLQQQHQLLSGPVIKTEAPEQAIFTVRTAREYLKKFKDGLLKSKQDIQRKQEKVAREVSLTPKEENMCTLQALHKAAWDGQAKAAFDLANRVGDFNARLKFDYTPLHQAVLGSVGVKRRSNMLTAERLIDAGGADVGAKDVFGRTPLHHASRRGDIDMMDLLISKGAEVNAVAFNGSTPLHCAAESGGVAAVEKLLIAGATETSSLARVTSLDFPQRQGSLGGLPDPCSLGNRQGSLISHGTSGGSSIETLTLVQQCGTALHWAARAGQDEVVLHLLQAKFDANAQDWHGTTPLQAAAREYRDVFPDRLEVGDYRVYIRNFRKKERLPLPPLKEEKGDRYLAVMRYLLGYGADREAIDTDGRTALHVAAACGNLKCVKLLLSGKDNTMYAQNDNLGYNPLMLTVIKSEEPDIGSTHELGSVDSEREFWKGVDGLLSEWNVNDNKDNRGRTALHLAVLGGKTKVAEHLINRGAKVDAKDENNASPLLLAARAQHLDCVKVLLENKPDIDTMDKLGCSSLSAAASAGDLSIVEMLLEHGANVDLVKSSENGQAGDEGRTALHDAAEAGNPHVVELLLKYGANVNHASSRGKTPLHVAARYGNTDVVQILLDTSDIDIDARDCKGRTALKIAEQHGLNDIVDILKQQKGDAGYEPAATQASERRPSPLPCDAPEDTDYSDWKSRFNLLNAFVKAYERVPAPDEWYKNYPIGSWVELQKEKIRWDEMPEEELQAIGSVGRTLKDWGAGIPWMDWLQNVKEYIAANDKLPSAVAPKKPGDKRREAKGPTPTRDIDQKILDLGWWCKFQQCRRAGKEDGKDKSSLDADQIKELDALRQWKWDSPKDRNRQRILLCLRLQTFCMKYNRLPRPDEHYLGVPLGRWCEVIRKLKLWSDLPLDRQQAIARCVLNEDGTEIFNGSVRALWNKFRPSMDDYLECLKAFVKENGRLPTRNDVGLQSINIGMWLKSQRQKRLLGKLDIDLQQQIDEIFKSNAGISYWSINRRSIDTGGDLGMKDAGAGAAAVKEECPAPPAGKNVEGEDDEAKKDEGIEHNNNSSINNARKKIRDWKGKASKSFQLKPPEVLEWIQACRQHNLDNELVNELPPKPEAGRTFVLERSFKFRQDGYKWRKESRSVLKVNGEEALLCCYAVTTDGTLQRRIYWELQRPSVSRDLVLVHYIDKKSSPLKGAAFEAELDAKAGPSSMAAMDMLATAAASTGPPPRLTEPKKNTLAPAAVEIQPFDEIVETETESESETDESNDDEPAPKRVKRVDQGDVKQKEAAISLPSNPAGAGVDIDIDTDARPMDDDSPGNISEGNPFKTMSELLKELSVPRIEKEMRVSNSNSQFAAIADQVYGDYSKHPDVRDLVVEQLRGHREKYRNSVKIFEKGLEDFRYDNYFDTSIKEMAKDRIHGTPVTLQAAADAFETIISVARDNGEWNRYIGFIDKPKKDPIIITFHSKLLHYNSTEVEEELKEEKVEKVEAARRPPPLPPVDTKMKDVGDQEFSALATNALPAKVIEMVSTASLDNQFAMSTALRSLYNHGVGGPAMRWAANQMIDSALDSDRKKYIFQSVKDCIVEGKLQEAAECVEDMQGIFMKDTLG